MTVTLGTEMLSTSSALCVASQMQDLQVCPRPQMHGPISNDQSVDTFWLFYQAIPPLGFLLRERPFPGVLIEDQEWPKSCGHVEHKRVVSREEAVQRICAAVDARDGGADILIVARTDARQVHASLLCG